MQDKVVVSFADGAGQYIKMMARLDVSLTQVGFDGRKKLINDYGHINSPLHKGPGAVPYAFKALSIKKAIEEGGRYFLWCDSKCYATKSIGPIFDHIKEHGYLLFDNIGYSISDYTSDACIAKYGISRSDGFNIPMIMACVMGFDKQHPIAQEFLQQYIGCAENDPMIYATTPEGVGSWTNENLQVSSDMRVKGSRHDQSVASCIAHNLGMTITNAQETYFAYVEHIKVLKVAKSVCLWAEGI